MTAHIPLIVPLFVRMDCRDAAWESAVLGLSLILQARELEQEAQVPAEIIRRTWLSASSRLMEAAGSCCYAFDHATAGEAAAWEEEES